MNISGVTSQNNPGTIDANSVAATQFDNRLQDAMTSVASLLGTSLNALQTSKQSLSQLAASKGISQSQLTDAIKSVLQQEGTTLSGERLDNLANRIATHRPHHHHRGAHTTDQTDGTTNASPATSTPSDNASQPVVDIAL